MAQHANVRLRLVLLDEMVVRGLHFVNLVRLARRGRLALDSAHGNVDVGRCPFVGGLAERFKDGGEAAGLGEGRLELGLDLVSDTGA